MKQNIFISHEASISDALKKLDISAEKVLLVVDENKKLIGTLTDGDLRRAILNGNSLERSIDGVFNSNPHFLVENNYDYNLVRELFLKEKFELIPVVDVNHIVVNYILWDNFFAETEIDLKLKNKQSSALNEIPVIIMAGGKGTRMAPFTNVLPKPLIPVGDKTILELIIDSFRQYGSSKHWFTLNYRGEMIKAYFDCIDRDYSVDYVWEKEFNGTAASIKLIEDQLPETFIVSNCDIIVNADYGDVVKFHKDSGADLTIISSIQNHVIPYGVVEFKEGGIVTAIKEKPEFSMSINTGVYVLSKKTLSYIPDNSFFHMTHLIEALMADGHRVVTYPIKENDYTDIGQWEEYQKAISLLKG